MKKVSYFIIKRSGFAGDGMKKPSKDYYKEPVRGYLIDDLTAVARDGKHWRVDDIKTGLAIYNSATREQALELFRSTYENLMEEVRSLSFYKQAIRRFKDVQEIRQQRYAEERKAPLFFMFFSRSKNKLFQLMETILSKKD